jgi:hypothetical protein
MKKNKFSAKEIEKYRNTIWLMGVVPNSLFLESLSEIEKLRSAIVSWKKEEKINNSHVKRLQARVLEFRKVVEDILECPYRLDEATIPKAGIDSAPAQVVGIMSMCILKYRAMKRVMKGRL